MQLTVVTRLTRHGAVQIRRCRSSQISKACCRLSALICSSLLASGTGGLSLGGSADLLDSALDFLLGLASSLGLGEETVLFD